MKNITDYKCFTLAVTTAAALTFAGCGSAVKTENTVPVTETEITVIEDEASPKAETASDTFTDMSMTMYAENAIAGSNASVGTDTETASTDSDIAAAIAKYGPNIVIFDDGTIFDPVTWQQLGTIRDGQIIETTAVADGFNRVTAEAIWSYVNAERVAAGLNEIAWDEDIYNFSCQRAQDIVTNFSHNGSNGYGENILLSSASNSNDAYYLHMMWHNSTGHYNNYMSAKYTNGACAVYVYQGMVYAVENFRSPNSPIYITREVNGQTVSVTQAEAEAVDSGNIWTASNGIVLYILSSGNITCHATGDEATVAILEYDSCH